MSDQIEYPSVDLAEIGSIIHKLHDQVSRQKHRVHLTRADSEEVCVMISKSELESLENAIAIFSDTESFNQMCQNLQDVLKTAGLVYAPPV